MAELLARLERRSQQGFLIFNASEHPAATTVAVANATAQWAIFLVPLLLPFFGFGEIRRTELACSWHFAVLRSPSLSIRPRCKQCRGARLAKCKGLISQLTTRSGS